MNDKTKTLDTHVSVGRLAEETGVKPGTLRMWERRYGRPRPERLPSGHRRYSMSEVRYIRRVVEAMALGHRPGEILRVSEERLGGMLDAERIPERHDDGIRNWLLMLRRFDGDGLLSELREIILEHGLSGALDKHIGPFLSAVGSEWADGLIGVRHEHFLAEMIESLLSEIRQQRRSSSDGAERPVILLATLPGETHGLGLSMTAAVAETAEWETLLLGVDSPVDEIAQGAHEAEVRAVALSVSLANGGARTDAAIKELRRALEPERLLLVGGQGVRHRRRSRQGTLYLHDQATLQRWLIKNRDS